MERNEDLERRILAAPGDVGGYAVYGDWLTVRGDPRGELVAVQIARSDPERSLDRALAWHEEYLLRTHRDRFAGALAPWLSAPLGGWLAPVIVEHRLGFLGKLRLEAERFDEHDLFGLVVDALGAPEGRFVQSLDLAFVPRDEDFGPLLARLARVGPFPTVRELSIGGHGFTRGDLGGLWATFPRLRKLTLRLPDFRLGTPVAPELEELVMENASMQMYHAYTALFAADLPRLRSVIVDCPRENVADALGDLFAARTIPRLRRLSLLRALDSREIVRGLARSRLLPQLKVLDLTGGKLGGDEAAILARSGRLGHLARLVVSENELFDEDLALLRAACPNLVSDGQGSPL